MSVSNFKAHPWHGISPGQEVPKIVTAFIEIVPTDTVKYEIDKTSGYLKVDRPQKFSNIVPALYGFIPQTYSGKSVARFAVEKAGRKDTTGDGDPLDILVLTERPITTGDIILKAIPIGGFRLFDSQEVDDKIIAVMLNDAVYGKCSDIDDLPEAVVKRLRHYFLTYKNLPDAAEKSCEITHTYHKQEAWEVISSSIEDYKTEILNAA